MDRLGIHLSPAAAQPAAPAPPPPPPPIPNPEPAARWRGRPARASGPRAPPRGATPAARCPHQGGISGGGMDDGLGPPLRSCAACDLPVSPLCRGTVLPGSPRLGAALPSDAASVAAPSSVGVAPSASVIGESFGTSPVPPAACQPPLPPPPVQVPSRSWRSGSGRLYMGTEDCRLPLRLLPLALWSWRLQFSCFPVISGGA